MLDVVMPNVIMLSDMAHFKGLTHLVWVCFEIFFSNKLAENEVTELEGHYT